MENTRQTFVGRTTREAFARVRDALGKDAVILEQVRQGGMVRIVASAEFPQSDFSASPATPYLARLTQLGFDAGFVASLPGGAENWQQLESVLLERIPLAPPPAPPRAALTGTHQFIGAPGTGKTTTIIKLMAEQVLYHGSGGCTLISTDCRRLAGSEPLALAAELLGVRFLETNPEQLNDVLAEAGDQQLVLVDTAGVGPGTPCPPAVQGARCVFIVPATWQAGALRRLIRSFHDASVTEVVLTQIDQADTLGGCLSVIAGWGKPIRWLSRGPELYDDIQAANRNSLAQIVLQGIDRLEMSTTFS